MDKDYHYEGNVGSENLGGVLSRVSPGTCILLHSLGPALSSARHHIGKRPMRKYKIIVEKHPDGYVAYPIGIKGIVVGQGDTYEQALSDVKSAVECHLETFGSEAPDTSIGD